MDIFKSEQPNTDKVNTIAMHY